MGERSKGVEGAREAWGESMAGHRPAYPLGNERDAEIIAENTGRPVEDFRSDEGKEALRAEQAGEVIDDHK